MTKKFLSIGELLWDVLPDERKLGGAPANLALRLNEMGNPTWLLTRVGDDEDGKEALRILQGHNFKTELIQVDKNYPTGTVDVFFDEFKNPGYTINFPAAYDFMEWNDSIYNHAAKADCVAFGTLVQRSEKTALTLHRLIESAGNALKFCDINLRKACYNQTIVERSLKKATIVKLNHHEAIELGIMFRFQEMELTSIVEKLVKSFDLEICLVTLEEQGALATSNAGNHFYSPGYNVKMEDPLGAGDAFSAAFLNEYLETGNIKQSLEAGNLFGALVVEQKGAMQSISKEAVKKFQAQKNERVFSKKFEKLWQANSVC